MILSAMILSRLGEIGFPFDTVSDDESLIISTTADPTPDLSIRVEVELKERNDNSVIWIVSFIYDFSPEVPVNRHIDDTFSEYTGWTSMMYIGNNLWTTIKKVSGYFAFVYFQDRPAFIQGTVYQIANTIASLYEIDKVKQDIKIIRDRIERP